MQLPEYVAQTTGSTSFRTVGPRTVSPVMRLMASKALASEISRFQALGARLSKQVAALVVDNGSGMCKVLA